MPETIEQIVRRVLAWNDQPWANGQPIDGGDLVEVFAEWREELKGALDSSPAPAQIVVQIKGGMVENIYGHALPPGLSVMVVDCDTQDEDPDELSRVTLVRATMAPHRIVPKPLTIRGNVEQVTPVVLTVAPAEENEEPADKSLPFHNARFADRDGQPQSWSGHAVTTHDAINAIIREYPGASKIDLATSYPKKGA